MCLITSPRDDEYIEETYIPARRVPTATTTTTVVPATSKVYAYRDGTYSREYVPARSSSKHSRRRSSTYITGVPASTTSSRRRIETVENVYVPAETQTVVVPTERRLISSGHSHHGSHYGGSTYGGSTYAGSMYGGSPRSSRASQVYTTTTTAGTGRITPAVVVERRPSRSSRVYY